MSGAGNLKEEDTPMRHAHTDHDPMPGTQGDGFDPWSDAFASAEADDALDRQLFALRESLTNFSNL